MEGLMPIMKKRPNNPATRTQKKRIGRDTPTRSGDSTIRECLNDLTEQIEIMVPEMTARIASLEHLLLEKRLCTREDLIRAREFVRIQED